MTTTWRYKHDIVMFHLSLPSAGDPVRTIGRATEHLLALLPALGTVTSLALSTRSGGEHAVRWTDQLDAASFFRRLADHPDTVRAAGYCDLYCHDAAGAPFTIHDGLSFWTQLASPDSAPSEPIELTLVLHTDVYLPTSWGDNRDNRAIAARNAPAFNAFLARLRTETGATIDDISADDYAGQLDRFGVRLPA